MESIVREILDVLLRWVHVVAGIMWVGNSLLFNWLDRNLVRDPGAGEGPSARGAGPGHIGRIWLLHSGGFYDVEKKLLAPGEMPPLLHWFKWQAYTTWATGFILLALLYWTGGASLMIDPAVSRISPHGAVHVGAAAVIGGWIVYDVLWRLLGRFERAAVAVSLALVVAIVWALTHVLSGRAAFLHVGAMLGTLMAGNVAMHIIPSQRRLVAATKQGRPQDVADSDHAKQRSIHNNYMAFPLLLAMLSNHFSIVYGNRHAWALLLVLFAGGALVRHWLNVRLTFRAWIPALAATVVACVATVTIVIVQTSASAASTAASGPPVAFASVKAILGERCAPCHADHPRVESNPPAPVGVRFDTPEQVAMWRERISYRVVVARTMPLNNRTAMTDDERDTLARWFQQGAPTR